MSELITNNMVLTVCVAAAVVSTILMVALSWSDRGQPVEARLSSSGQAAGRPKRRPTRNVQRARVALPKLGDSMMPDEHKEKAKVRNRVVQAGLYQRHAASAFLGAKLLLSLSPVAVGVGLAMTGWLTLPHGILYGAVVGLLGTATPGLWLDMMKSGRQKKIRRSLPDALDVIVICLGGGLSLPASFDRVGKELATAHPLLADEMAIVRREVQLGKTSGEALRRFANRFDIEEVRSMASVVSQAERFGASVTKALQVHADSLRMKRFQHAEGQAQKAPVKLIFPTVLCIFPALYIVLMFPAGVLVYEAFRGL